MFSNAKKVQAVTPAVKAKAAAKAVDAIPGYAKMAAIDACIKQLTTELDLHKVPVKAVVLERMLSRGLASKAKPATMTLADAGGPSSDGVSLASGNAYLGKRPSNRPLAAAEIELLAELFEVEVDDDGGLTVPGITETREKQPSLLAVNPAYAGDEVLLKRIDQRLKGVQGIPEDFIIQQAAVVETIVSDSGLDQLFSHPANVVAKAVDVIGGIVFRPVFKDVMAAWQIVRDLLAPPEAEAEAKTAEAKVAVRDMLVASAKAG
jgi:hypothetical protein